MDPSVAACPICQHGRPRDVIASTGAIWVSAAREAPLPGYVCIVSKVHVIEPYQLRGPDRHAFWDDVSTVAEAVQRATDSPKLNYEVHGNTIPHLHMHIFPRFAGDPFEGQAIDPSGPSFFRSDADLAALKDALAAAGVRS